MPVSGSRAITMPAVMKRPLSPAVCCSTGNMRPMSKSLVCTCSCAGARSTITGGLGSPIARATKSRNERKSTPNAASQLAWHEIRLPTTGTS